MPTYSQKTSLQLHKDLQELEEQLRKIAPELVAEMDLVRSILKSRESQAGPYALCGTTAEAVDLCFDLSGDYKLSQKEMLDAMLSGGYTGKNPKNARGLLNDRINYLLENKYAMLKGDFVGRNQSKKPSKSQPSRK